MGLVLPGHVLVETVELGRQLVVDEAPPSKLDDATVGAGAELKPSHGARPRMGSGIGLLKLVFSSYEW